MDLEIERFKRNIDLTAFAASKGYRLDQRESSVSCRVLRHSDGDKIIVGRARDGHWQYFSIRDPNDNGSIIDFVQKRQQKNLGEVRIELRAWTHTERDRSLERSSTSVPPVIKDRKAVAVEVARAIDISTHPYLEERGLRPETLCHPRFQGTWKQAAGPHRNVLFLHHDIDGLSGFESKNANFSGFAKGGSKGLWQSLCASTDTKLVITESAIDALSYHQLHPDAKTRYVSVGGALNSDQPRLLALAMTFLKERPSTVIAATDNDKAGHELAQRIARLATDQGLQFQRHCPSRSKDWNDHLRSLPSLRLRLVKSSGLDR